MDKSCELLAQYKICIFDAKREFIELCEKKIRDKLPKPTFEYYDVEHARNLIIFWEDKIKELYKKENWDIKELDYYLKQNLDDYKKNYSYGRFPLWINPKISIE